MKTATSAGTLRLSSAVHKRRGNSSMELVMATAVALPLAVAMLFLGFKICTYVFSGLSGLLSMPFL